MRKQFYEDLQFPSYKTELRIMTLQPEILTLKILF